MVYGRFVRIAAVEGASEPRATYGSFRNHLSGLAISSPFSHLQLLPGHLTFGRSLIRVV